MSEAGDIPIKIEIFGVTTLDGFIDRIYAPLTADAILYKMPFVMRGRFSFGSKNYWTLPGLGLREGINPKSTKTGEKGDLLYNPKTDELIIVIENFEMPNKVNKIGKVTINEKILNARNGLNTKVFKIK
ncbi:MAG: hypothetical protein ACFFAH_05075 [Promethearchaeota archaeon]